MALQLDEDDNKEENQNRSTSIKKRVAFISRGDFITHTPDEMVLCVMSYFCLRSFCCWSTTTHRYLRLSAHHTAHQTLAHCAWDISSWNAPVHLRRLLAVIREPTKQMRLVLPDPKLAFWTHQTHKWTRLVDLVIGNVRFDTCDLACTLPPNLTRLVIEFGNCRHSVPVRALTRSLTHLRELVLGWRVPPCDGAAGYVDERCAGLTRLFGALVHYSPDALRHMSESSGALSSLLSVDMTRKAMERDRDCSDFFIGGMSMAIAQHMPRLTEFVCGDYYSLALFAPLMVLPELRILDLGLLVNVLLIDWLSPEWLWARHKLRSLDIRFVYHCNGAGVAGVAGVAGGAGGAGSAGGGVSSLGRQHSTRPV